MDRVSRWASCLHEEQLSSGRAFGRRRSWTKAQLDDGAVGRRSSWPEEQLAGTCVVDCVKGGAADGGGIKYGRYVPLMRSRRSFISLALCGSVVL
jgi:hypothetical protein